MFNIFLRRFLWKVSITFSVFFVNVHNSLLYINTGLMKALKILILMVSDNFLFWSLSLYLLYIAIHNCFCLLMSESVSSIDPKYLHFFHSSPAVALIVYCSVLSKFIFRFLNSNFDLVSILISSSFSFEVVAHPISSANCSSMFNILSLLA